MDPVTPAPASIPWTLLRELLTVLASLAVTLFTVGRKIGRESERLDVIEKEVQTFATRTALDAVSAQIGSVHADVREIRQQLSALLLRRDA